jgi:hypothetical protein
VVFFRTTVAFELLPLSVPMYEPDPLVAGPTLKPGFVPVVGVAPGNVTDVGAILEPGAHVVVNVIGVVEGLASDVQLLPVLLYEAWAVPLAAFTVPPPATAHFFSETFTVTWSVFAVPPVTSGVAKLIEPVTLVQVRVPGWLIGPPLAEAAVTPSMLTRESGISTAATPIAILLVFTCPP